jgi:hypothetical protein
MARTKQPPSKDSSDEVAGYAAKPNPPFFDTLRGVAYAGIFVVAAVAASNNGFGEMWVLPAAPAETALFAARFVLFVELLVLAFRWIIATHHELELWLRWLENPFGRQEMYAAIFGLSVVLGLLLAFPHKIVFISGFVTVYFLLSYWTQWLSNDHFDLALQKTRRRHLGKAKIEVLDVMEYYWLKRPQLGREVTMMFFSSGAFSLAFAGGFQQEAQRLRYQFSAYVVLILDILIGEIVIALWRRKREQGIRQAIKPEGGGRHVPDAK